MPPVNDTEFLALFAVIGPLAGFAVGWFLARITSAERWDAEQSMRWYQQRRDTYARFLAASERVEVEPHEDDVGRAAVEELTTAYAELQIVASPPVMEAARTVFLHSAGSDEDPDRNDVPEGNGQGDFLAAVRTELGIDAVETR
jgi:hypothetical protein